MLKQENLAANFCGLLSQKGFKGVFINFTLKLIFSFCNIYLTEKAVEWRILGQEQNGSLLVTWNSISRIAILTKIGLYSPIEKSFHILYEFNKLENIIQASINSSKTLLGFIIKDEIEHSKKNEILFLYKPFYVQINASLILNHVSLDSDNQKQVMIQFLWNKEGKSSLKEKFIILTHEECESNTNFLCYILLH